MYKIFLSLLLLASTTVWAQTPQFEGSAGPNTPIEQYFQEADPNYDKSIIYVFFNNNDCYECPQTIALIDDIYNQYYQDKYSFFIIDYQNDNEYNFIETYNLSRPLSVVLVRVDDGQVFGFEKLDDLQNQISDPVSFSDNFRFRVDSFLGNNR